MSIRCASNRDPEAICRKASHLRKVKLNGAVMAHVSRKGKDIDWLHENMELWGFGDSLRALNYKQTLELYALVRKALV
jgi:hypothetical protein